MKFETVLFAVAFLVLALISLPDKANEKKKPVSPIEITEAADTPEENTLASDASENLEELSPQDHNQN